MKKTKQTLNNSAPGASGMSDGDLLQRVNAVHDGMSNNQTHQNLPVDISLHQLKECRIVQHTISPGSNMNEETGKPVPPLTAWTADGKLYTRFADVEAEIGDVWCRPPAEWIARRGQFKSETLVCLICKGELDDYTRGLLLDEVNARTGRISESEIKGLDDVVKEETRLEVQAKIFDLLWSGGNCAQAEFLEIAFAEKVRDLTKDAIKRYKRSSMARREQLQVWTDPESAKGAFAAVELRNDAIDTRGNQEDILILYEDESRRDELWLRIHAAVKDHRHFQALYLFHGEGKSLKEIATQFHTTAREIRYWKDTAMHQIRVALGLETEEKRKALRRRRRARRAKRQAESKSIRPSPEPPGPLGLGLSHP
jgi:hypothetical protein